MCFEKDILYTCEKKREYGTAAVAAYCRVSTKKETQLASLGSSNYGIYGTDIRSSRLGIFRSILGLWKKWIKEKGP